MIDRRRFLTRTAALLAATSLGARAWAQPPGDGRLLFGYPAGALGSEVATGALAVLAASGGPRYRLENIEGRNTRTATETAKVAAPDGLTLLQGQSTSMCLLPNVYKTASFDPLKDFTPLATVGEMTLSLTVGPIVPAKVTRLKDYLDWLSDNPEYNNIGFAIYGGEGHLATLILARSSGMSIKPQAYKGSLMMISDLLNGSLSAVITAAGNGRPQMWANGKLRTLGVTTEQRLAHWPSVPSLAEQGIQDMNLGAWYGWFAPAATPANVVAPLREKIVAMQATPAYAELHKRLLLTQQRLDPEQIEARIRHETARYAQLVATYGPAKIE